LGFGLLSIVNGNRLDRELESPCAVLFCFAKGAGAYLFFDQLLAIVRLVSLMLEERMVQVDLDLEMGKKADAIYNSLPLFSEGVWILRSHRR